MTEQAAGRDGSPPARAREDSDPATMQGTAAGGSGPAVDRAATAGNAASGAVPSLSGAHPGAVADGADGSTEPPSPGAEGGRASSVLTNGTLGRAGAAALGASSADAATASAAEAGDRLGRPGRPALAFAAIAGVVLMAAPFAVNETSQRLPGTAFDLVDREGFLGYFVRSDAGTGAESTAVTAQRPSASGLAAGVAEQSEPDSGYVPEVLSQEEAQQGGDEDAEGPGSGGPGPESGGASDDGSSGSSEGEGSDASVGGPSSGSGGDEDDEDRGEDSRDTGSEGEPGDSGDSEADGDSPPGGLPDHNTNGPLALAATRDSGEDADAPAEDGGTGTEGTPLQERTRLEQRPASVGEPLSTDDGTQLSEALPQEDPEEQRSQEETGQEPPADEQSPEEEPPPPPEFRYAEVAGVGCAPNERIAYGTAGEFWEGDGTHSWAFGFEGGFDTESCDGRWHAIPVSGDPDAPNGRYAFWTFKIGFTDAACDIYVHIPDAESPRWVGGAPAQYQLHPSADPATSEPFASFTVDQVASKGGWVHVGTYTPPGDTISVKLQNSGADRIDGQDTNAHVVASAVRTRCN